MGAPYSRIGLYITYTIGQETCHVLLCPGRTLFPPINFVSFHHSHCWTNKFISKTLQFYFKNLPKSVNVNYRPPASTSHRLFEPS